MLHRLLALDVVGHSAIISACEKGRESMPPKHAAIRASCVEPTTRTLSLPTLKLGGMADGLIHDRPRYTKTALLAHQQHCLLATLPRLFLPHVGA